MLKVLSFFKLVFMFVIPVVMKLNFSELDDPARRAEAIKAVHKTLDDLGIKAPDWLQSYLDAFIGTVVDLTVFLLKKLKWMLSGGDSLEDL